MKKNLLFAAFLLFSLIANAQTITEFVTGLTNPKGIAVNSANILFVAESARDEIYSISSDGTKNLFVNSSSFNNDIAFNSNDNLYIVENFFGQIFRLSPDGSSTDYVIFINNPYGITLDSAGNLFYTITSEAKVVKVTPDRTQTDYARNFISPEGIAFDKEGILYVADSGDRRLLKVNPDGFKTSLVSNVIDIKTVAVGPDGNIYYNENANFNNVRISRYNVTTEMSEDYITGGINGNVNKIIFDQNNVMFASLDNGTVLKIEDQVLSTQDLNRETMSSSFYPNPSYGTISFLEALKAVNIYDLQGKLVYDQYNSNQSFVDISDLDAGVYAVYITDQYGNKKQEKLIKI